MEPGLPKKLYYTLAEVSEITGVKSYVLRYWDKEFRVKRRRGTKNKSLRYHREELKKFLRIKGYLYGDFYSIAGAKKKLSEETKGKKMPAGEMNYRRLLLRLKKGLRSIEAVVK